MTQTASVFLARANDITYKKRKKKTANKTRKLMYLRNTSKRQSYLHSKYLKKNSSVVSYLVQNKKIYY